MKKIMVGILFIFVIIICCKNKTYANELINLCVVYDEQNYEKGDIIDISFDLPKFSNLFEVIIRLEYDESVLEPVLYLDEYFYLDNHSIFEGFVINKKFNNNILYAEMIKSDIDDGYYSSYKNNLCKVKFKALTHIDDIDDFFSYDNISLYLFDINHNIIDYNVVNVKRINAYFTKDLYEVAIGESIPLIKDIFTVSNRLEHEFVILEENKIDVTTIGQKVLQVGIFDLITGEYTVYSTIINIVDKTPPIITYESEYCIKDIDLDIKSFYENINILDNYDQAPKFDIKYKSKTEIISEDEAIKLFKKERYIECLYQAYDSSNNYSEEIIVKYYLIDTTSPIVHIDDITINDVEFDQFDLNNYLSVEDNLDSNPKYYYVIYNKDKEIVEELKSNLTVDNMCFIGVVGIDDSQNKSEEKIVKIMMRDTISPNIIYNKEEGIPDVKIDSFDFNSLIIVEDNSDVLCKIEKAYFFEEEVSYDEFILGIKEMNQGIVKYYVYDNSLNQSYCEIKVFLKDTTPPEIIVNVKDNDVFKKLDEIVYEVKDNISSDIVVNILLDDKIYDKSMLIDGNHCLFIEAIDEAGNVSQIKYNFVISKDSYIEEVLNHNLKLKSGVIIGFVLLSCLLIVFAKIKITMRYKNVIKEK